MKNSRKNGNYLIRKVISMVYTDRNTTVNVCKFLNNFILDISWRLIINRTFYHINCSRVNSTQQLMFLIWSYKLDLMRNRTLARNIIVSHIPISPRIPFCIQISLIISITIINSYHNKNVSMSRYYYCFLKIVK